MRGGYGRSLVVGVWLSMSLAGSVGCSSSGGGDDAEMDAGRVEIASSVPMDGADGVSVRTSITVGFSGAMDPSRGNLELVAGGETVTVAAADANWNDADDEAVFELLGELPPNTPVTWSLTGAQTADGRALAGETSFSFETGTDDGSPELIASRPREGQLDVDPDTLDEISLTFDEAMDTNVIQVDLFPGGGERQRIVLAWDAEGRTATVNRVPPLPYGAEIAVDVTGLRDRAGNPATGAGDGRVDFITGPDMFDPFIQGTTPAEGRERVSIELEQIEVVFSEAMDESVTEFTLAPDEAGRARGATDVVLEGAYSEGGVVLTLPVPETLTKLVDYALDLRNARDVVGNPLVDAEPFTGDGILDFLTEPPSGESCEEALVMPAGTTVDGVTTFELPPTLVGGDGDVVSGTIRTADGGAVTCAGPRTQPEEDRLLPDAVFEYVKTTDSLSDGGAALEISIVTNPPPPPTLAPSLVVEVVEGETCAPATERLASNQLWCVNEFGTERLDRTLDVGPGTYHVFLASESNDDDKAFPGATVRFREVASDDLVEGESCLAPLTEESPGFSRPSANTRRWVIDARTIFGQEAARSFGFGSGALTCNADPIWGAPGADAVLAIEKSDPNSLLRIDVRSGATPLRWELLGSGCASEVSDRESVGCGFGPLEAGFDGLVGRSGTFHLWLAATFGSFPRVTVDVEEVTVASDGDACGQGLPLVVGENPITTTGRVRNLGSSCLFGGDETAGIVWYQRTLTKDAITVEIDGDDAVVLRQKDRARDLGCYEPDFLPNPVLAALVGAGETVCLGVVGGAETTSVTVVETDYTGPGASSVGSQPPSFPVDYAFAPSWMAVDGDDAYMGGFFGEELVEVNLDAETALRRDEVTDGISPLNSMIDGAVVDGTLFGLGDPFIEDPPAASFIYRLSDGASDPWDPTALDQRAGYPPGTGLSALFTDGTALLAAPANPLALYELPLAGGAPVPVYGGIIALTGVVVDAAATVEVIYVNNGEAVYRLPRVDPGGAGIFPRLVIEQPPRGRMEAIRTDDGRTYLVFQDSDPIDTGAYVVEDLGGDRGGRRLGVLLDGRGVAAYDDQNDRLLVFDRLAGGFSEPRMFLLD